MSTMKRACVIGYPARHSRSPLIHNYWLQSLGLRGSYTFAEVAPPEFPAFVHALIPNGFVGANVTLPHKQAAFAACERVLPTAEALAAANTLWFDHGKLVGDNTDVGGFLANLDERAPGWDDNLQTAVVLGAGGVARALVYALQLRGVRRCLVLNRTLARAENLKRDLPGSEVVEAASWDAWPEIAPQADFVVNATSLGMTGQPPLALDLALLPPRAVVADTIYVPLETELLVAAKARGLIAVDGLGMLLHQAVPGFERWFGARPKVTEELRNLVIQDIAGAAAEEKATGARPRHDLQR